MSSEEYQNKFSAQLAAFNMCHSGQLSMSAAILSRAKYLRLSVYDRDMFTYLLIYGNAFEASTRTGSGFTSSMSFSPLDINVQVTVNQPTKNRYKLYSSQKKFAGTSFTQLKHYRCPLFLEHTYLGTGGRPAIVFDDTGKSSPAEEIEAGVYDWVWNRREEGVITVAPWTAEMYSTVSG